MFGMDLHRKCILSITCVCTQEERFIFHYQLSKPYRPPSVELLMRLLTVYYLIYACEGHSIGPCQHLFRSNLTIVVEISIKPQYRQETAAFQHS